MRIANVPVYCKKLGVYGRKYEMRTAFNKRNTVRHHIVKTKPKNGHEHVENCISIINVNVTVNMLSRQKYF